MATAPPPLPRPNRQQWWCSGGGALHSIQPFSSQQATFLGHLLVSAWSTDKVVYVRQDVYTHTHTQKDTKQIECSIRKLANYKVHQCQQQLNARVNGSKDMCVKTTTEPSQTTEQLLNAGLSHVLRKHD